MKPNLDINELSSYYHTPVDTLYEKSLKELMGMNFAMLEEKVKNRQNENAESAEYRRIVKKFLTPYPYLHQYFTEDEIVMACAVNITEDQIATLKPFKTAYVSERKELIYPNHPEAEFVSEGTYSFRQFTKQGKELLHRKSEHGFLFRISNNFQTIRHGDIFRYLVYKKYPELKPYDIQFYSYTKWQPYEVYTADHIMLPFEAMMTGNTDAIFKRNIDYAKSYNHGLFTTEQTMHRMTSENARNLFLIIKNIGEKQQAEIAERSKNHE